MNEPSPVSDLESKRSVTPDSPPARVRIGDLLVSAGLITETQVDEALRLQKESHKRRRLGEFLVEMGAVTEEQLAVTLAERLRIEFVDLNSQVLEPEATELAPIETCRRYHLVPWALTADGDLCVAMADPTDVIAIDDVQMQTYRAVIPYAAVPSAVERAIDRLAEGGIELVQIADAETDEDAAMRATRLVDAVIDDAVRNRASDVHFEPKEDELIVRARIDGRLRTIFTSDLSVHPPVISRIKVLAGLDISERRRPQDGRLQFTIRGRRVSARVSTIPSVTGEKAVLRIVDHSKTTPRLSTIGLDDADLAAVRSAVGQSRGLVLIAGPTGSGKTTTLYAALDEIANAELNIVTLEDPVERVVRGAVQTQIDESIGITFPTALRSIVRQDPDVVMVGEIRDTDTASISLKASLTGHLVMSTIHTNDAASTVTRLIDMQIEPYLISAALSLVVAQRLVRKICVQCKAQTDPPTELADELGFALPDDGAWSIGPGCDYCMNTGYYDRVGIYELLPITDQIIAILRHDVTAAEVFNVARQGDMRTLLEHGFDLAVRGVTTLAEVSRVAGESRGGGALRRTSITDNNGSAVGVTGRASVTPPGSYEGTVPNPGLTSEIVRALNTALSLVLSREMSRAADISPRRDDRHEGDVG